ncbi:MAG: hypothetical protein K0R84_1923 [Clostridia bacterium]|nr:hypothetical protein [Clostridia bacterium]
MKKHTKVALFLLVVLLSAVIFAAVIHTDLYNINNIKALLTKLGKWAPAIFVLLCVFRTFMFLPCGFFSGAAGALFGPVKGTLLTLIGFILNSLIIYLMAGYFGRDWVKGLLKDKFDSLDEFVNTNSFSSFLFLRVVPLLPFDGVSCLGGISKAKLSNYLLATAIGSIPGVFIYTYFGDSLKNLSVNKIIISAVVIVLMAFVPLFYKLGKYKYALKKNNKHV